MDCMGGREEVMTVEKRIWHGEKRSGMIGGKRQWKGMEVIERGNWNGR